MLAPAGRSEYAKFTPNLPFFESAFGLVESLPLRIRYFTVGLGLKLGNQSCLACALAIIPFCTLVLGLCYGVSDNMEHKKWKGVRKTGHLYSSTLSAATCTCQMRALRLHFVSARFSLARIETAMGLCYTMCPLSAWYSVNLLANAE